LDIKTNTVSENRDFVGLSSALKLYPRGATKSCTPWV
jgi:hypothetical protein